MRTKTIKFNLTERGINKAIKELQEYKKRINQRLIWLLETMRLDGETYAASYMTHYGTGITSGSIVGYREGNRAVIEAGGAAIWIEFGTGVTKNPMGDPFHDREALSSESTTIYKWGEYGEGHGKDKNGWYYLGDDGEVHHTMGIMMQPFMHNAAMKLKEEFRANAEQVFRK